MNNYINHVVLVLDESGSMSNKRTEVAKVADNQIAYLAQRSKELDQETRITVYTFNTRTRCLFYDMDVLRLPSLVNHYMPDNQTALIDATLKAIDDLEKTATLYGDHAFLIYVLTDGQENASITNADKLRQKLNTLPDNWTLAAFVPDAVGIHEAKRFGFSPNNIAIWNTNTNDMKEVGEVIRRTTDNYMSARTQGFVGTRNLFQLDLNKITAKDVEKTLDKLSMMDYYEFPVDREAKISDFVVSHTGQAYKVGKAFYELNKPETIQPSKEICIKKRTTGDVYTGHNARQLLGLPDYELKVKPGDFSDFDIYIQSTSTNRKLVPGTNLLLLR